ncbi:MAG: manganese efflux pump MntP family protein [Corynebacterium sp.]|nr:manganese efflux pump MntP family protein [Corynebacterium sp.]
MPLVHVMLLSCSVAADAFACSIARGTVIRVNAVKRSLILAGIFGVFQALMPVIGWGIGYFFAELSYIRAIDHWVAFLLLAGVGAKMIWDALHQDATVDVIDTGAVQLRPALILGLATSIDALAIGMGMAFIHAPIMALAAAMGVTTFVLSLAGAWMGHHGGGRFGGWATGLGGLVLIGLGSNILLDHMLG